MKRKRYSESFKAEAVKLVPRQGRSLSQAARDLGISVSGLRQWVKNHEVESGHRDGLTAPERVEIRELKRELDLGLLCGDLRVAFGNKGLKSSDMGVAGLSGLRVVVLVHTKL